MGRRLGAGHPRSGLRQDHQGGRCPGLAYLDARILRRCSFAVGQVTGITGIGVFAVSGVSLSWPDVRSCLGRGAFGVAAWLVLSERDSNRQLAGLVLAMVGVTIVAA
jgi:hypothetical protein